MKIVVGGVGELYQGDLDFGRRFVEQFEPDPGPAEVFLEDFHYGAVAVSQRIEEVSPQALVLVGAERRQRTPGRVYRSLMRPHDLDVESARLSVESAATGYVTLDLVVEVLQALGTAPPRVVVFELEPEEVGPSDEMSEAALSAIPATSDLVRREIALTPLFALKEDLRTTVADDHLDPSASFTTVRALIEALDHLDDSGSWGEIFSLRDRLRLQISEGEISEKMTHLDWSLWWSLIEELERLQAIEADSAGPGPAVGHPGGPC